MFLMLYINLKNYHRQNLALSVITLMQYEQKKIQVNFPHFLVIFLLMLTGMITIGVVIILQDLFIKEWIEYYFLTLGKSKIVALKFKN